MADRALGDPELPRELLRRAGVVAEQGDDRRANVVGKGTQLVALGDDEDVRCLVVGALESGDRVGRVSGRTWQYGRHIQTIR